MDDVKGMEDLLVYDPREGMPFPSWKTWRATESSARSFHLLMNAYGPLPRFGRMGWTNVRDADGAH